MEAVWDCAAAPPVETQAATTSTSYLPFTLKAQCLPGLVAVSNAPAQPAEVSAPLLAGRTIAIARDAAFAFVYPANLDVLSALGARLVFFSPLAGDGLPACDAIWLPGGYPELHADVLSRCGDLRAALGEHVGIAAGIFHPMALTFRDDHA